MTALYRYCLALVCWLPLTALGALTPVDLTARLAALEPRATADAGQAALLSLYTQTKALQESQATHRADIERYARALSTGPATLRKLAAESARISRADVTPLLEQSLLGTSAADLQRLAETAVNERAALENKLNALDLSERALAARPAEITQLKAEVLARIAELEVALSTLDPHDDSELGKARQAMLQAELGSRELEIQALNEEQLSHSTRLEISAARRRIAEQRLALAGARVSQFEELLLVRQTDQLRRIQEDATNTLREPIPVDLALRTAATENVRLGEMLATMLADQSQAVQARAQHSERRRSIAAAFDRARQRTQLAGTSASLGRVLVEERRNLPQTKSLQRLTGLNEATLGRVGLQRIEIDEQLRALQASAGSATSEGPNTNAEASPLDAATLLRLKSLRADTLQLLETLDETQTSCLRALDSADFELQQLLTVVVSYRRFLDERLLWLPNTPPVAPPFFRDLVAASHWLLSPSNWLDTLGDLQRGAARAWLQALGFAVLVVVATRARKPLRRRLAELAPQVNNPTHDRFRNTLLALLIAGGIALPWALLLLIGSIVLTAGYANSEFTNALGQVLARSAWLLWALHWWGELLSPHGVAVAHFACPARAAASVRQYWLRWGRLFVPCYAVATLFDWGSNLTFQDSFQRLFFLFSMGIAVFLMQWATRSQSVIYAELSQRFPSSWLCRARPLWAFVAVAAPLVLALLSVFGYHYAAVELSVCYLQTLLLLLVSALLYSLALRWLQLAQNRIAAAERALTSHPQRRRDLDYTPPDFAVMNARARLIFRNLVGWSAACAFFWIWREVLPALGVLDQVSLWDVELKDAEGALHVSPITLANLAMAAVIGTIAVLAARNMPGLLEISLLQRLPMHRGSRYAVNMLVQYVIVAIGITLTLSTLGLRWGQVQWLVAALGVGLGFGLQEIFANFVSGLILLFERPVRVGDFVTIGELSGRVTRIQIRATTICDADNREIIVPNKNFITERFLNWTLTDAVTRLVIPVGVAYGSNTDRALTLLLDIARAHPNVLHEPAPCAVFQSFGDSALLLELQVYAKEINLRVDLRHELNTRIYRAFAEHGIEIPRPQREVLLRSVPPDSCLK